MYYSDSISPNEVHNIIESFRKMYYITHEGLKDKKENLLYMSKNMAVRFAKKNAKLFSCIAFVGAGWEGKIRI